MARMVTVPCEGVVFDVTVSDVPVSFPSTDAPASVVLASVVPLSFTVEIDTNKFTVAVAVCPAASVTVYVNESDPEYPVAGT